ncbi:MAG: thioredoxin family protein [Dehalococcoidia bacterium]
MASKPAVDGLERELDGEAVVIRMNIDEDAGWEVARRYGALVTPTFIVFSPDGAELHREYGYPDIDRLRDEARDSITASSR